MKGGSRATVDRANYQSNSRSVSGRNNADDGIQELHSPSLHHYHRSSARSGGRFGEREDDVRPSPHAASARRVIHDTDETMDDLVAEKMNMLNRNERRSSSRQGMETMDDLVAEKMDMMHNSGTNERGDPKKFDMGNDSRTSMQKTHVSAPLHAITSDVVHTSGTMQAHGSGGGSMMDNPDETKKRRFHSAGGTNRSSTMSERDDAAREKQGPRMAVTNRDMDYDEEEGTIGDDPQRTGAYFISGTGDVVTRQRGVLTSQPSENDHTVATKRAPTAEVTPLDSSNASKSTADGKDVPWYCSRKFKLIALIALIVGGAVGAAVGITSGGGGGVDEDDGNGDPPVDPVDPEESALEIRRTAIRASLLPVSGADALDDQGSPQNLAMNWLVYNDTLTPVGKDISEEDLSKLIRRYSLAVVYFATGGESWFRTDNWLNVVEEECEWEHMSCEAGEIVSFDTGTIDNNVAGAIPPEIGQLSFLRQLLLPNNQVSSLPSEMGDLNNLTSLDLKFNALEGPFPSVIYELTSLTKLILDENGLNGTISTAIAALSDLDFLSLPRNSLTGVLTVEFQSLSALTTLNIFKNSFQGSINEVFRGLTNLDLLRADSNELSGTISTEIGFFTNLGELNLGDNRIENSTIPTEIGELTKLVGLFLFRNNIVGTIPSEMGRLRRLQTLFIENTNLVGSIPSELCTVFETVPDFQLRLFPCTVECNCSVCDPECQA